MRILSPAHSTGAKPRVTLLPAQLVYSPIRILSSWPCRPGLFPFPSECCDLWDGITAQLNSLNPFYTLMLALIAPI